MDDSMDNLVNAMDQAIRSGGIPVAMIPYQAKAPAPEFYLDLLRHMVNTTGNATGGVTFGTKDACGLLPLVDADPLTALGLLLHMRTDQNIDSVGWVVVADDTLRRMVLITPEEQSVAEEKDCLMATCVEADGPGWLVMQTYTKTPSGVVVWGDVEKDDTPDEAGGIVELMTKLVTA